MAANAETTIAADASFNGRISGEHLNVLGTFEGDIVVKGSLKIGPEGKVKAKVQAALVEVRGQFEGEIGAGTLVLGETARVRGTIKADKLSVREGAVLDGAVNRSAQAPAPTPAVATAAPAKPADTGPGSPS